MKFRLRLGILICLFALVSGCGPSSKERADAVERRNKFLSEFNPALKVLRDQLAAEVSTLDDHIRRLKRIRSSFTQKDSRAFVTQRIERFESQRQNLKQQLDRIDAEAEKGVALREFNKMDGGGIASTENANLAASARQALGEARRMTDALERELGGSKGASQQKANTAEGKDDGETEQRIKRSERPRAQPENQTQNTATVKSASLAFTHTFRVVGVQGFLTLRVEPSASSRSLARIPANASGLRQRGFAVRNGDTMWMPVEFGGVGGFVNAKYLALARGSGSNE